MLADGGSTDPLVDCMSGVPHWAQVYKRERLQPLSYYAHAEQAQPMAGLLWGAARDSGDEALRARCQMVRRVPLFNFTARSLLPASCLPLSLPSYVDLQGGARPMPSPLLGLPESRTCRLSFCAKSWQAREGSWK